MFSSLFLLQWGKTWASSNSLEELSQFSHKSMPMKVYVHSCNVFFKKQIYVLKLSCCISLSRKWFLHIRKAGHRHLQEVVQKKILEGLKNWMLDFLKTNDQLLNYIAVIFISWLANMIAMIAVDNELSKRLMRGCLLTSKTPARADAVCEECVGVMWDWTWSKRCFVPIPALVATTVRELKKLSSGPYVLCVVRWYIADLQLLDFCFVIKMCYYFLCLLTRPAMLHISQLSSFPPCAICVSVPVEMENVVSDMWLFPSWEQYSGGRLCKHITEVVS